MAHVFASALEQADGIEQRRAVEEADVYVRREYVDVAEGRVAQAGNRTAVVHKLADFVAAVSHHVEPVASNGSEFTRLPFQPGVDGGVALHGAVESGQIRFHRCSSVVVD